MSDLEYIFWIAFTVAVFSGLIALLEWYDPNCKAPWKIKAKLWWARRKYR